MTRYLLDTAPLAAFLLGRPAAVNRLQPWLDRDEAAKSILVYGEIIEYLAGLPRFLERQVHLRRLLRVVTPLFLTYSVLERYALLRRDLRPPRGPGLIGDIDALIAATALERGLILVTIDGDFARVPELPVILLDRHTLAVRGDGST